MIRSTLRSALVAVVVLVAAPLLAQDTPVRIELKVGQTRGLGMLTAPICDDPKVAVISADQKGTLKAVGPGKTLCSAQTTTGIRQVFEVVVTAPKSEG